MTGWTQFTARFERGAEADALVEDAEASPHRVSYAAARGDVARVRIVGYDEEAVAKNLLEASGDSVIAALVASFNDTSDSGNITILNNRLEEVGGASCPVASRWDFRLEAGGMVETGVRAGNDFSLAEEYE